MISTSQPYVVYRGFMIVRSWYMTWKCMERQFISVQSAKNYIDKILDKQVDPDFPYKKR